MSSNSRGTSSRDARAAARERRRRQASVAGAASPGNAAAPVPVPQGSGLMQQLEAEGLGENSRLARHLRDLGLLNEPQSPGLPGADAQQDSGVTHGPSSPGDLDAIPQQDSGVTHGSSSQSDLNAIPQQQSGVTHGPSAPGGAPQQQPTGAFGSVTSGNAPLPAVFNPAAVYNAPGAAVPAPVNGVIGQASGWDNFFIGNNTQNANANAPINAVPPTTVPTLSVNLTTGSFTGNATGTSSASAQAISHPSLTTQTTTPSVNQNRDAQANARPTTIDPFTSTSSTSTPSPFTINTPTHFANFPIPSGLATTSTPIPYSTPGNIPAAANVANLSSPSPRHPLPSSANRAPTFATMGGKAKSEMDSDGEFKPGRQRKTPASRSGTQGTAGEKSEPQTTATPARGASTAKATPKTGPKSIAKKPADQATPGSSKNTTTKSRKGKEVALQPAPAPEGELPFRMPNQGQMISSDDEEETSAKADRPAAFSSYADVTAKLPAPEMAGQSSSYALPAANLPQPERPFELSGDLGAAPVLPSSAPMNESIPVAQSADMEFDGPVPAPSPPIFVIFPALPGYPPVEPPPRNNFIDYVDNPIVPCALDGFQYVYDIPINHYNCLEPFITGADGNGGVLDEEDRLFQMGIQAGIAHGCSVFKVMLAQELAMTGRVFGRVLARDFFGQTSEQQADLIYGDNFYERSASKLSADNHIQTQALIREEMERMLRARQAAGAGGVPAQSGVVSGYSVGPATMEAANTPAQPGLPGHHLPETHANMAPLAGVPTIGGLDLTQMDGYAGTLVQAWASGLRRQSHNRVQNDQNNQAAGGQNNMFVFGAGNQNASTGLGQEQQTPFQFTGVAADASMGEANDNQGQTTGQGASATQTTPGGDNASANANATAVLTETKDGRAVIQRVPEKQ